MKFPSINQFRHVIRKVADSAQFAGLGDEGNPTFDRSLPLPILRAVGTVKLHGTNAGVKLDSDGNLECWSRTKKISVDNDNQGFAKFCETRKPVFDAMFRSRDVMLYGEWCGTGIQKGCGINELDKMFVIFAGRITHGVDDYEWLTPEELVWMSVPDQNVHNIYKFPTYALDIDFANPGESQNELINLTQAVEDECPVAKHFGVSGIGEGIVWTLMHYGSEYWFKVKGEKHSVTKVKKLAEVDVEKLAEAREFAEITVTEARCLQGISTLDKVDQTSTGAFLKWIVGDIIKEESDRLGDTLTKKDVTKQLSILARTWFFRYLDAQEGLTR